MSKEKLKKAKKKNRQQSVKGSKGRGLENENENEKKIHFAETQSTLPLHSASSARSPHLTPYLAAR